MSQNSSEDWHDDRDIYRYTSHVTECPGPEPSATWGVQFCHRPSHYHLRGHAYCWKNAFARQCRTDVRPPPSASATNAASVAVSQATSSSDTVMESAPQPSEPIPQPQQFDDSITRRTWRNLFATVNACSMRVYEARRNEKPTLLSTYVDEDSEEIYYCLAWTFNANNDSTWWILVAGRKGVIRVINTKTRQVEKSLVGHGEAVNDVKVHPRDPALVVSASKDESLRLWNLRTGSSIAVFAGLKGHRGEVVSVDFNSSGDRFASCGIDNSIRVWEISSDEMVIESISESHNAADIGVTDTFKFQDENEFRKKLKVPIRQFPSFVTRKVHKHYVDCVMWINDLLLSKSVHNRIYLWEPGKDRESLSAPATSYTLLQEYYIDSCNIWFIRFALDRSRQIIACGNEIGKVHIFRVNQTASDPMCLVSPRLKSNTAAFIRQCAFSDDGSIIISVDDGSNVNQFDRMPHRSGRRSSASMRD